MFKLVTDWGVFDFGELSDWVLVNLARKCKCDHAAHGLVERHMEWIAPLVRGLCKENGICDPNQVDDALQEAILAFEKEAIERYDLDEIEKPRGCKFRSFAERVARDRFKDFGKKEWRAKRRSPVSLEAAMEAGDHLGGRAGPGHGIALALASTRDDPEAAAERAEQSDRLRRAISQLPSELQQVVKLFLDELSTAEMAERLRISYWAAWRRLQQAFGEIAVLMARPNL
ncbi:MAG: sigma-70 family RNA polymerase sigma factor [Planctomycetes bacterium]|nr:sigma-70 family RNA polymerase sigma factor [Planctomycetota bacterium]